MTNKAYRVSGTLLATKTPDVFRLNLDVADVDHTAFPVSVVVSAADPEQAAADAAWLSTNGYASWRWNEPPKVEELTP